MSSTDVRTWSHPELGELRLGVIDWEGKVELPSFAQFESPLPVGRYFLALAVRDSEETRPGERLVDAAVAVVEAEAVLADRVLQSLWDDLNGTGPESGNWWHRKLGSGEISAFVGNPPMRPDDLIVYLELLSVHAKFDRNKLAIVELNFRASWEDEHGIGVLVARDGTIDGIGYMHEAMPFGPPRRRTERFWNPFRQEWVDPS